MQILNPLLTDDQHTKKDKRLERKYRLKKKNPSKNNSQHVASDTTILLSNNEVLSSTNGYSLLNDTSTGSHKDELITIQESQLMQNNQIQNDSVYLQDLAGDNQINDMNETEPQGR